jgi:hypothetical protein
MNEPQTTYWDTCIASLPPEKRAAAERAYQEIAGVGEDGQFSKMFLLLEAHAACSNNVLTRISDTGEQMAAQMREAGKPGAAGSSMQKADLAELKEAIRALDIRQPMADMNLKLGTAAIEVKRLNRQISRLRNFRVGMAIFLMVLTVIVTLLLVWLLNQETIHNAWELKQNGLVLKTKLADNKLAIIIGGEGGTCYTSQKGDPQSGVIAEFPLK